METTQDLTPALVSFSRSQWPRALCLYDRVVLQMPRAPSGRLCEPPRRTVHLQTRRPPRCAPPRAGLAFPVLCLLPSECLPRHGPLRVWSEQMNGWVWNVPFLPGGASTCSAGDQSHTPR